MKRLIWLWMCIVVPGYGLEVEPLVEELASSDFKTRMAAEKQLRELPPDEIASLQPFLDSTDVEIRNRVKNIIQYIRDHGPQGLSTLQATIMDPRSDSKRRAQAISTLCTMVAEGDPESLEVLNAVASRPTLGLNGDDGRRVQSQVMTAVQQGIYSLGARAAGNPKTEAALIACLKKPSLRNHAMRALGNAAGKGSKRALEVLLNPAEYGLTLASTISSLRPPVAAGNRVVIEALGDIADTADEGGLFQVALTLQSAGAHAAPLVVPVLEKVLNKSVNSATLQRAVMVLETITKRKPDLKAAKDLLAEWKPKVDAASGRSGVRARASATIRVEP